VTPSPLDALVRDRVGLDPGSLGSAALPTAVGRRMAARRVATPEAYAGLLTADSDELAALTAELVVPETWFFRGGRPLFDHLAGWVADRAAGGRLVRVLSLPCSTGEEPYSLAIALRELGAATAAVRIDGVDLVPAALARAAAGRFTAFAFREAGDDPRPWYFRPTDDGRWELAADLRRAVRFLSGNAVDPALLAAEPAYDLILCRHLFIYLTPEARDRVVANLGRLLAADGLLCVSPAEAARLPAGRFAPTGPAGFCLFQRAVTPSARVEPGGGDLTPRHPSPRRKGEHPSDAGSPSPSREAVDEGLPFPPPPAAPADPLASARELADAGKLDAAIAAYEHAALAHTSADGFSLLGLIELARGHPDAAARAFRKALYLDPDHPEALSHMIVLCRQRGETGQADALRRRLARVEREEFV